MGILDFPHWRPHSGGLYRRGLEIDGGGNLLWAFLREGEARSQSVFLDKPDLTLVSLAPSVAEAQYLAGGGPKSGYPVKITPKGVGQGGILAMDGVKPALLGLQVSPQRMLTIAFRQVKSSTWHATSNESYVDQLIDTANALYRYQGNIAFQKKGALDTVEISSLGDAVDRGGALGFESWSCHVSRAADLTVFFVKDYENSAAGGGQWAGQHREWMVFEPSIKTEMAGMVFAHELGHFLGLDHPIPAITNNLLNQTSAGDRHRYKSYLTREQIEKVSNPANWDNKNVNVCSAVKTADESLKQLLRNFGL